MAKYRTRVKETIEAVPMQWGAQITLSGGEVKNVKAGDFLITREDGSQEFMPRAEFEERYEEVKSYGRPRGSRNKALKELQADEAETNGFDLVEDDEEGDGEEEEVQEFRPHPKPSSSRRAVPQPLK